ncbi:MAG: NAD(P) transhydrogenase subunit alpha [Spirochaetes bacterium]|nr:NAD(P) transhydrogenase subunit alpha [Spirochaetota bacterium]
MADPVTNLLSVAVQGAAAAAPLVHGSGPSHLVTNLTVFVLAVFVGYYVVWRVTPALHSPLMAVTNAISSVIVVGAIIATGVSALSLGSLAVSQVLGFVAVMLASVNIFGGFVITGRMLGKFKKKVKAAPAPAKKV